MKILFALLLALIMGPAFAQFPKADQDKAKSPETGLRVGVEKGFCGWSRVNDHGAKFYADREHKNLILHLTGPAFAKWREKGIGSCFKSEPKLAVVNAKGKPGTIYRFAQGVIVEHGGKAYYMGWPIAQTWWPRSGVRIVRPSPTAGSHNKTKN